MRTHRFLAAVLAAVLLLGQTAAVYASDQSGTQYYRDNELWRYTHNSSFDGYTVRQGIDVSTFQGDIDWPAVKAAGVEFAFIRLGYRGYGWNGSIHMDDRYHSHMQGAVAAGIPVGIYFFSQAVTRAEAEEEADFILSQMGDYPLTLPIVMDYEFAGDAYDAGRIWNAGMTREEATGVCLAFCRRLESAGYRAMLYADANMLTTQLDAEQFCREFPVWLASWYPEARYDGDYTFWQFSDSGTVDGISWPVDLDFWYADPTGWQWDSRGQWYRYPDGTYPASTWVLIEDRWYYFDAGGYMVTGWLELGGRRYYLERSGAMASAKWLCIDGLWYHFAGDGHMQTGWLDTGGKRYYLSPDGAMAADRWIEGKYYMKSDGSMARDEWVDGGRYYVDSEGRWVPDKYRGWLHEDGVWRYSNGDGTYPADRWALIDGEWYHFNADGVMQTGWLEMKDGRWYYLNRPNGNMRRGWLLDGGKWFYLDPTNGHMRRGWLLDGGRWYYLDPVNGHMRTGWVLDGGKWYYLDPAGGHMVTDAWIGNYYVSSSGEMATSQWVDGRYYVDSSGRWVP